ncbi:DUF998 domain-containing protein [Schumannella sp. 10F1B-5-1]|uniref:DUF998 domain-containing protein n=1 Tax=Schumannella sp. 10F1B-5-1 TaxID=2590780 RepID=UPI00113172D2|nr:DUF998 domain-containing protein [Schumannella sp. 10F1B-5-1]TPW73452.1 DUF998 domain-containing protein [Schumannella sp. 10F1B-5-1]
MPGPDDDLDRGAAATRSLLGWGVVAGPFYVVVGLVLALTRPGFELSRHALSLLMLGDLGWLQRANLALTGLMVLAAAVGIVRAIRSGRGLAIGVLTGVHGVALVLSAVFAPDPVAGFPPGSAGGEFSLSGILHLLFGAIGFVAIAVAAFAHAAWSRGVGRPRVAVLSVALGVLVLLGFAGGAALSGGPAASAGIALLWIAVLAQFGWLARASSQIYAWSPHPLRSKRG